MRDSTNAAQKQMKFFHDDEYQPIALTAFPDSAWTLRSHDKRDYTLLAGIRASENNPVRLPSCLFKATSGYVGQDGNTQGHFVRLTVAGAAQAGLWPSHVQKRCTWSAIKLLLPVELRYANHTASTNIFILAIFP